MHHTNISCTSKPKSHISLKELWSETKVRRTLLHILSTMILSTILTESTILFHFAFLREQENSWCLFKLLNFWSLCLCLSKTLSMLPFLSQFSLPLCLASWTSLLAFVWPNFLSRCLCLAQFCIPLPLFGSILITLPCTIREIYIRQSLRATLFLCLLASRPLWTSNWERPRLQLSAFQRPLDAPMPY